MIINPYAPESQSMASGSSDLAALPLQLLASITALLVDPDLTTLISFTQASKHNWEQRLVLIDWGLLLVQQLTRGRWAQWLLRELALCESVPGYKQTIQVSPESGLQIAARAPRSDYQLLLGQAAAHTQRAAFASLLRQLEPPKWMTLRAVHETGHVLTIRENFRSQYTGWRETQTWEFAQAAEDSIKCTTWQVWSSSYL